MSGLQAYLVRRVLLAVLTVWSVLTLVFIVMRLVPGDPALVVLGDNATEEALQNLRRQLGLDKPLPTQYLEFLGGVLTGRLGNSVLTGEPVASQIFAVLPYTVALAVGSMIVGSALGIPLGIISAVHKGRLVDYIGRIFAVIGLSTPAFYLGIVLILVFAVKLKLFPVVSRPDSGLWNDLHSLVLPSFSLGLIQTAFITRMTRSSILEILREDFVRTARSKGLPEWRVIGIHVLRNGLIPIVTVVALYTGALLGGAILTETVFNRPGLGKLLVGAIRQRDYPIIQGGLALFTVFVTFINLAVDVVYALLDPRVKFK